MRLIHTDYVTAKNSGKSIRLKVWYLFGIPIFQKPI